jgi:hypothetical protein
MIAPAVQGGYDSSFSDDSESPVETTSLTEQGPEDSESPLLDVTAATEQSINCTNETLVGGGSTPQREKRGKRSKVSLSLNGHLAKSVTKNKERERTRIVQESRQQERQEQLHRVSEKESMARRLMVQKQQIDELKTEKAKLEEKTKNVARLQRQMHAAKREQVQSQKSLQVRRHQIDALKTMEPVLAEKDEKLKALQDKVRASEDEFACMQKSKGRAIGLMKEIVQRGSMMTNQLQKALESSNEKATVQEKLTKKSEGARKQQQIRIAAMQRSLKKQRDQIKKLEVLKPTQAKMEEELSMELSILKQQARMQSMQKELRSQRQTIQQFAFLEPELNTKTRDLEVLQEDMRVAKEDAAVLHGKVAAKAKALLELEEEQVQGMASKDAAHQQELEHVMRAKTAAEQAAAELGEAHKEAIQAMDAEHSRVLEEVREAAQQEAAQAKVQAAHAKEDTSAQIAAAAQAARQDVEDAKEETKQAKEDARKHELLMKESAREDIVRAKQEIQQAKEDARKEAEVTAAAVRQELLQAKDETKEAKESARKQVAAARQEVVRAKEEAFNNAQKKVVEDDVAADDSEGIKKLEEAHKEAIQAMDAEHSRVLEEVREAAQQEVARVKKDASRDSEKQIETQKLEQQSMREERAQLQSKQAGLSQGLKLKERELKSLQDKHAREEAGRRERVKAATMTHEQATKALRAKHATVLREKEGLISALRRVEDEMEVAFVRECEKSEGLGQQLDMKRKEYVGKSEAAEKEFKSLQQQKVCEHEATVNRARLLEEQSKEYAASFEKLQKQTSQHIAENSSLRSRLMSEKSKAITNQRIVDQQAGMATIELQAQIEQLQSLLSSAEVRLKTTLASQKAQSREVEDVRRENKRVMREWHSSDEIRNNVEATLQEKARNLLQVRKQLSSTKAQLAQKEIKLGALQHELVISKDEIETIKKNAARDRAALKRKVVVAHKQAMKATEEAHTHEMVSKVAAHKEALSKAKKAKDAIEKSAHDQAKAARQEVERAQEAKEEVRQQAEEASQAARLEVMQAKQLIVQANEESRKQAEAAQQEVEEANQEILRAKDEARMQSEEARLEVVRAKQELEAAQIEAAKATAISSEGLQRQIGQMRAELQKAGARGAGKVTTAGSRLYEEKAGEGGEGGEGGGEGGGETRIEKKEEGKEEEEKEEKEKEEKEEKEEDNYADESYAEYEGDDAGSDEAEVQPAPPAGSPAGSPAGIAAINLSPIDIAHVRSPLPAGSVSGGNFPSSPLPGQVQTEVEVKVTSPYGQGDQIESPPPSYEETEQQQQHEQQQKQQLPPKQDDQLPRVSAVVAIQAMVRQVQAWRRFQQMRAMEAAFRRCATSDGS